MQAPNAGDQADRYIQSSRPTSSLALGLTSDRDTAIHLELQSDETLHWLHRKMLQQLHMPNNLYCWGICVNLRRIYGAT